MFSMLLKLIVLAVIIRKGLTFLKNKKESLRKEEIRRLLRFAASEAKSCKERLAKEDEQRRRTLPCALCGKPTTIRCARCKLVQYCSGKCEILHWRQGHRYECVESKDDTKTYLEKIEESVRYLEEEELTKSKIEDLLLESEGNNWSTLTNSVGSLMRESYENPIAEEARIDERSKYDKHTQMIESECAKAINELTEGKEQVRVLKLEVEKITVSMRKVVDTGSVERRGQEKCIQMLKNELVKAMRELEEERKLVELVKMECEDIRQKFHEKMEKMELELVYALDAAVAAEEKLSDLEREVKSLDDKPCAICLTNEKDMAFGCGHMTCGVCMATISNCHICRKPITNRLRLFPG